jgi:DNA-binding NarL/FixJ family response regulator
MQASPSVSPQPWPWPGRPRVLVENDDAEAGLRLAELLRESGYGVAVCPGPTQPEHCPLAGPEGCAIAHGADVVVSSLGLARPESREVLQALRSRCPDLALVVEVEPGDEDAWPDLLAGCELVHSPVATEELRSAVSRALAGGA